MAHSGSLPRQPHWFDERFAQVATIPDSVRAEIVEYCFGTHAEDQPDQSSPLVVSYIGKMVTATTAAIEAEASDPSRSQALVLDEDNLTHALGHVLRAERLARLRLIDNHRAYRDRRLSLWDRLRQARSGKDQPPSVQILAARIGSVTYGEHSSLEGLVTEEAKRIWNPAASSLVTRMIWSHIEGIAVIELAYTELVPLQIVQERRTVQQIMGQ